MCAQHLWRRLAVGEIERRFSQLGRWWDGHDEIDLVGLWARRVTMVGECEWSNEPIAEDVLAQLQVKATKLPLADRVLWVLCGRGGFTSGLRRRAQQGDLLLLGPADMF